MVGKCNPDHYFQFYMGLVSSGFVCCKDYANIVKVQCKMKVTKGNNSEINCKELRCFHAA